MAEISTHTCNFLDITIYKAPSFYLTGLLSTKIYYKPTNSFAFPLGSSYMPSHIHKGIAIGEMTSVIRDTTSPSLCNLLKRKLIKHFRFRNYPKHILRVLASMRHQDRKAMLLGKRKKQRLKAERGMPVVLEYMECRPTLTHILKWRWRITRNDFRLMTLFPFAPTPIYILTE